MNNKPKPTNRKKRTPLTEEQKIKVDEIRRKAKILLDLFITEYPRLFCYTRATGGKPSRPAPKPLAVGIHRDLMPLAREHGYNMDMVFKALRQWTHDKEYGYQLVLAKGGPRYDLDGRISGEVDLSKLKKKPYKKPWGDGKGGGFKKHPQKDYSATGYSHRPSTHKTIGGSEIKKPKITVRSKGAGTAKSPGTNTLRLNRANA